MTAEHTSERVPLATVRQKAITTAGDPTTAEVAISEETGQVTLRLVEGDRTVEWIVSNSEARGLQFGLLIVLGGAERELIDRLQADVAALRRWKAEATSVITAWDDAFDAARIGDVLGSFKWAATFAEIERLRAAVALLWDLMPDDQCFDVSARAPKTYVLAQDLWGQRLGAAAGPHHPAARPTSEVQS